MTPNQVIKYYGSVSEAARKLIYTRAAIARWKRMNRIPRRTQEWIEMLTDGALRAGKQKAK